MFKAAVNLGMILAGACTTIFAKIVEEPITELDADGALKKNGNDTDAMTEFKHPLVMNLFMFGGETLLILVFALKLMRDPIAYANYKEKALSPAYFILPAIMDTLGSFLNWTGVYLISASSYAMLRMFQMVAVVFISVTLLDRFYSQT